MVKFRIHSEVIVSTFKELKDQASIYVAELLKIVFSGSAICPSVQTLGQFVCNIVCTFVCTYFYNKHDICNYIFYTFLFY